MDYREVSVISELLDAKSLLAAARSSSLFDRVVKGDPVLKKTLESAIRIEQQEIMEPLTRPGMAASISRDEHAMLFGTNSQKIVTIAKSKYSLRQVKAYQKTKECSGRKAKTTTTNTGRLLDSSSLLAAARSSPLFERVVEGDPILKKTVQKAKRDEEQEIMERFTRPGMAASISRDEHAMLFGTNRQKIVTIAKSKYSLRQVKSYHKKTESSRCKSRTTTTKTARWSPAFKDDESYLSEKLKDAKTIVRSRGAPSDKWEAKVGARDTDSAKDLLLYRRDLDGTDRPRQILSDGSYYHRFYVKLSSRNKAEINVKKKESQLIPELLAFASL
ncbi:hypothetical protein HUJ05_002718 [Dendroctonus ponderosae]|nr:hypothetical protein HUJ05_002718 [Dendroctonus ponderosae]